MKKKVKYLRQIKQALLELMEIMDLEETINETKPLAACPSMVKTTQEEIRMSIEIDSKRISTELSMPSAKARR